MAESTKQANNSDAPPTRDPKGVNPSSLGPAQPRDVDVPDQTASQTGRPGKPGDQTKDPDGGGI
jgi:hypothetical protein